LNDHWIIKEKNKREHFLKFLESNESEKKNFQNLWDIAKEVLKGKHIVAFIKKLERSQMNNLLMHLKFLEKQEQTKLNGMVDGKK
jgi:precorrin-3B methylase